MNRKVNSGLSRRLSYYRQTFLGAVFIVLINNAMNLIGVEWYTIMLIQGLLILLATVIDFVVKNSRNRAKKG